jgi:hypothetical protein
VQKLHLVGFTTDHEGLILSARRGARSGSFRLTIDSALEEAVDDLRARRSEEPEAARPAEPPRRPRVESALSVKEIQARLRTGRSIAEVARAAGVDVEWVDRFAPPVFAERAQVIAKVQSVPLRRARLGPSALPIGDAVRRNLADRGVSQTGDEFAAAWTARLVAEGRWAVRFTFHFRGRDQVLRFDLDEGTGEVTTADRASGQLGYVTPRNPTPTATSAERPRASQPTTDPRPTAKRAVVTTGFRPERTGKAVSRPAKEREKAEVALRKAAAKRAVEAERGAARKARERREAAARREREDKAAAAQVARDARAAKQAAEAATRAKAERAKQAAADRKAAAEKRAAANAKAARKAPSRAPSASKRRKSSKAPVAKPSSTKAKAAPSAKAARRPTAAKKPSAARSKRATPAAKAAPAAASAKSAPANAANRAATAASATKTAAPTKSAAVTDSTAATRPAAPPTPAPATRSVSATRPAAPTESAAATRSAPATATAGTTKATGTPSRAPAIPDRWTRAADRVASAAATPGPLADGPSSDGARLTGAAANVYGTESARALFRRGLVEQVSSGDIPAIADGAHGGAERRANVDGLVATRVARAPERPRRVRPLRAT